MGFEAQTSYRLPSPPPLRVFSGVEFGNGRDVSFELPGEDCGELLRGSVGIIHNGRRGVRVSVIRNDVPRRHPLEIHEVVRQGHGEGPQDTEAEGALGVFGNPTAQRAQATDHRTARDSTLPLELLTHAHGGLLQLSKLHLRRRERGVDRFLRRGLVRNLLP